MATPQDSQRVQNRSGRTRTRSPHTAGSIWLQGLVATGVATLLNLILYFIGSMLVPTGLLVMAWPDGVIMPLPWYAVALVTVVAMLVGTAIFHLLHRFIPTYTRLLFTVGAVLLVGISIAAPLNLSSGNTTQTLLSIMHVIPGVLLLGALLR